MVDRDDIFVFPHFGVEAVDNSDTLVPYESIVSLTKTASNMHYCQENRKIHTSEKAGAAIFLVFFQSSPSDATILLPYKART